MEGLGSHQPRDGRGTEKPQPTIYNPSRTEAQYALARRAATEKGAVPCGQFLRSMRAHERALVRSPWIQRRWLVCLCRCWECELCGEQNAWTPVTAQAKKRASDNTASSLLTTQGAWIPCVSLGKL
eukprot:6212765-Pleurochrysis_carterae.AAC.1